jgi:hypothetical protein
MFSRLIATIVRASLTTISTWEANYNMLTENGPYSLGHWDTLPIAATLSQASQGFPCHPLLGSVLPNIVCNAKVLVDSQRSAGPLGFGEWTGPLGLGERTAPFKFKLQQYIDDNLRAALYPDSVPLLLKRRVRVHWHEVPFDSIDVAGLEEFTASLSPQLGLLRYSKLGQIVGLPRGGCTN